MKILPLSERIRLLEESYDAHLTEYHDKSTKEGKKKLDGIFVLLNAMEKNANNQMQLRNIEAAKRLNTVGESSVMAWADDDTDDKEEVNA